MAKKKRKRNSETPRRYGISTIILLVSLAILILLFAGVIRLADWKGVFYDWWFIGLFWLTVLILTFILGIVYFGQFVLPHHRYVSWAEGVRMIWRNIWLVAPELPQRARRRLHRESVLGAEALPPSFTSLRAGILQSHQAMAVERGMQFTRALGPGFVRLHNGESIGAVIDLRPHGRSHELTVYTKDGIPLQTTASVNFRVHQSPLETDDDDLQYPYDHEAIFLVSQASNVDAHDNLQAWSEQIAPYAAGCVLSEMANYALDDLMHNSGIMGQIKGRVKEEVVRQFEPEGIEILSVSVSPPQTPQEIRDQQLENWRAPRVRDIWAQYAAGDAEATRRRKRARARAQVEIIQTIVQNIEEIRRMDQANLTQIIALRLIEALEEAMREDNLQNVVSEQFVKRLLRNTSAEMNKLLEAPRDERGRP